MSTCGRSSLHHLHPSHHCHHYTTVCSSLCLLLHSFNEHSLAASLCNMHLQKMHAQSFNDDFGMDGWQDDSKNLFPPFLFSFFFSFLSSSPSSLVSSLHPFPTFTTLSHHAISISKETTVTHLTSICISTTHHHPSITYPHTTPKHQPCLQTLTLQPLSSLQLSLTQFSLIPYDHTFTHPNLLTLSLSLLLTSFFSLTTGQSFCHLLPNSYLSCFHQCPFLPKLSTYLTPQI
ncbi:unnamed protein product [Acanthosepion pharaonis]|uniref:Uncharacterized protein n=1 Tax=Acanthosepion pharaonis TaxID=158019 RepID=A0A812AY39_ACAPH|nr:unnamed protein product [Sepia pharaonis]